MQVIVYILLLLDLDVPQTLDPLLVLDRRCRTMVVACVWICFGYTQSEEREREELENLGDRHVGGDRGKERIFCASCRICGRLKGAQGTFY